MTRRRNVATIDHRTLPSPPALRSLRNRCRRPRSPIARSTAERNGLDPSEPSASSSKEPKKLLAETKDIASDDLARRFNAETRVSLAAFKLGADGNAWLRPRRRTALWTRSMIGNADNIGSNEQISVHRHQRGRQGLVDRRRESGSRARCRQVRQGHRTTAAPTCSACTTSSSR